MSCLCQFEHVTLAQPQVVESRPAAQVIQWLVLADITVLPLSQVEHAELKAEEFSPYPRTTQQRLANLCVWTI